MQPTLPEMSYLRMTLSDTGVTSHLLGTEADFAYGSSIYKARPGKPEFHKYLSMKPFYKMKKHWKPDILF